MHERKREEGGVGEGGEGGGEGSDGAQKK